MQLGLTRVGLAAEVMRLLWLLQNSSGDRLLAHSTHTSTVRSRHGWFKSGELLVRCVLRVSWMLRVRIRVEVVLVNGALEVWTVLQLSNVVKVCAHLYCGEVIDKSSSLVGVLRQLL